MFQKSVERIGTRGTCLETGSLTKQRQDVRLHIGGEESLAIKISLE